MTDDVREMRDSIRKIVRSVLHEYVCMKHVLTGTSTFDLGEMLRRLELELGRTTRTDSDARDFVLTMDAVTKKVNTEIGHKGACTAAAWRLIYEKKWSFIADGLRCGESRAKEIVDEATAKLLAEIITRGITEDYRELPGLAELAA